MKNRKGKLIRTRRKVTPVSRDTCTKKIIPVQPFHKTFPYAITWTVKKDKKIVDTHFAYFSYEDHRDSYIKTNLKGVRGIKKFKTKVRKKND